MKRGRIIGLTIVLSLLFASTVWAKTYDHPKIEQTFHLLANGDADVEDLRTFRFDGSFSWAELRLKVTGQYGRYDVEYRGVWDAETGQPLRFETSRQGDERILKWYYQAQDTTKRFLLRYRIRNAVQRYRDAAQFYWKAIEDDHAPILRVSITLLPPRASPVLFKVFVHSKAAPGDLKIADDFSRAIVAQSRIPETSFVEVRVLLDPAGFLQAEARAGETYESLLADERRQSAREVGFGRLITYGIGTAIILVVLLVLTYLWAYLRYGKEPAVGYDAPYEHEPPRPLPPAVVPAIMTQSKIQNSELPKAFAATLLEAARLGYLEIEERQDQGLLGTGLFKDSDLVYRLTEKGQNFLGGRPVDRKLDERELEPFERDVLEAVFRKAGRGQVVTSDEIEHWGKQIVGSKSNFLNFIERWGPQLRTWFEKKFFKLDDPTSEKVKIIFIAAAFAVMVITFFLGFGVAAVVAWPVGIVLIVLSWKGLARRTPLAALEVKRWEAFRRFMTDFSAMKDAGPQLLHLWEHYLVYATALGVAEKLLENLKLVAADLKQSVASPTWYHGLSSPGRGPTAMSVTSLESLARSFQNFQHLSRALSSSTSSGGGFSGGGGGGGGGGSSRAG